MDKEMIERVAKVLSPQSWAALNTPCDTKAKVKRREASLDFAKQAIAAMREPTEKMLEASEPSLEEGSSAYGCWRNMIDAILGD